jgi:Flp pilus assembly pilin Flp
MLSITPETHHVGLGRCRVRELMLGIIAVGLVAGVFVGRNTERARRAFKDWGAAKTAVPKYRTTMVTEIRRALITGLIIAVVVIAVVTFAFSDRSGS